jgi:hypothetical protein
MTILFVGNTPAQFYASSAELEYDTSTEHRDSDFVPNDIGYTVSEGGTTYFDHELDSEVTDFWLHYRMYFPRVDNFNVLDNQRWVTLYDGSDNVLLRFEGHRPNNWIDVVGDTTGVGASFGLGQMRSFTIDIHVEVNGTTDITGTLYVNGAKVSTATVANTGGRGGVARVLWENYNTTQLNSGSQDTSHVSEIIMTSGEPTRGWRLAQLNPSAAGNHTDFTGTPDTLADGDLASGVSAGADGDRMSNTLTAYGGPATASGIRAVVAATVAAKGDAGPDRLSQSVRIGGTDYDGTPVDLATEYQPLFTIWDNDPASGVGWDTADFATMELGLLAEVAP